MKYINWFLIVLLFWGAFVVARGISRSKQVTSRNTRSFWEQESRANQVRKADISQLAYIVLDLSLLPMDALLPALSHRAKELEALASEKIINLSMYTNTQLKLMYGPANLEALSYYDGNYLKLIRLLNSIGKELIELGNVSAAKEFLSFSLSIGSDISETFTLLAEIYKSKGHNNDIDLLIKVAENLDTINKSSIINKLNNIKSNVK
ncbi:MAG: hypothetical protein IKJ73_07440 [Lachnospiraceae bacterium]|nr:hypothetical protein [Lachnospiraceae bacterium]